MALTIEALTFIGSIKKVCATRCAVKIKEKLTMHVTAIAGTDTCVIAKPTEGNYLLYKIHKHKHLIFALINNNFTLA